MEEDLEFIRQLGLAIRREFKKEFIDKHPISYEENFAGLCGLASRALVTLLAHYGYEAVYVDGYYKNWNSCHCWVEWEGWLVDITATQFGLSEVYLMPLAKVSGYVHEHVLDLPMLLEKCSKFKEDESDFFRILSVIKNTLKKGERNELRHRVCAEAGLRSS